MKKPVLKISNLFKSYGKLEVLKGLNLTVYPGDCIALLGVNGSGKSTLMEIILGLNSKDKGDIVYFPDKFTFLQKTLVVFQIGLYPAKMTIKNLVKFYHDFYFKPYDLERTQKIAKSLEIEQFWNQRVNNLSFGQKKKVEALVSLSVNADFYFIDELTAGTDINSRLKIPKMFRREITESSFPKGMIWITHDPNEIELLCNRVVILSKKTKNVCFDGSFADVKKKFKTIKKMLQTHFDDENELGY